MVEQRSGQGTGGEPIQERQGVREPQPLDRGVEKDEPERKVGDRIPGEGSEREGERAPDEPAEGPREPQEPRRTHVE